MQLQDSLTANKSAPVHISYGHGWHVKMMLSLKYQALWFPAIDEGNLRHKLMAMKFV